MITITRRNSRVQTHAVLLLILTLTMTLSHAADNSMKNALIDPVTLTFDLSTPKPYHKVGVGKDNDDDDADNDDNRTLIN